MDTAVLFSLAISAGFFGGGIVGVIYGVVTNKELDACFMSWSLFSIIAISLGWVFYSIATK